MPTTALAPRRASPARVTGSPTPWIRDAALVGGATGLLAPAAAIACLGTGAVIVPAEAFVALAPYPLTAGMLGVGTGLVVGACAPRALDTLRRWFSLKVITGLALLFGAGWGAAVGGLATLAMVPGGQIVPLGAILGATVGAAMLALIWLPYTMTAVLGGRRWPVVAAATVLAPLLGIAAWFGLVGVLVTL